MAKYGLKLMPERFIPLKVDGTGPKSSHVTASRVQWDQLEQELGWLYTEELTDKEGEDEVPSIKKAIRELRQAQHNLDNKLVFPKSWMENNAERMKSNKPSDILGIAFQHLLNVLEKGSHIEFQEIEMPVGLKGPTEWSKYPNPDVRLTMYHDINDPASIQNGIYAALTRGEVSLQPQGGEMSVERYNGGFLQSFFNIPGTSIKCNQMLPHPTCFSLFGSRPKPDFACLLEISKLGKDHPFVVFAAEAKQKIQSTKTDARVGGRKISAQLSASFYATLNLLALLHNKVLNETKKDLPSWCFLVGMTYDCIGVSFYAFYPTRNKDKEWKFRTALLDDSSRTIFTKNKLETKSTLLTQLLTVQRHTAHVIENITAPLKNEDNFPEGFKEAFMLPTVKGPVATVDASSGGKQEHEQKQKQKKMSEKRCTDNNRL